MATLVFGCEMSQWVVGDSTGRVEKMFWSYFFGCLNSDLSDEMDESDGLDMVVLLFDAFVHSASVADFYDDDDFWFPFAN